MEQGRLEVFYRSINYPGHEDEIHKLEDEFYISEKLNISEIERIKKIIEGQYEAQRNLIGDGFKECRDRAREEALRLD